MGTTKNMYYGVNCVEQCMPTVEGQVNLQSTDISKRLKDISPPDNSWAGGGEWGWGGGVVGGNLSSYLRQSTCTKEFACRVITSQMEVES